MINIKINIIIYIIAKLKSNTCIDFSRENDNNSEFKTSNIIKNIKY